MPLFKYICNGCGLVMTDKDNFICKCGDIFALADRVNWNGEPFKPYIDDVSGDETVYIDSKQKREQVLKERGVRIRDFKQGKYSPTSKIFAVSGSHKSGRGINDKFGG